MSALVRSAEIVMALLLSPLLAYVRRAPSLEQRNIRFQLGSEFMSLWPFRLGMFARRVFYRHTLAGCGSNPLIRLGTTFVYPQACISSNVLFGKGCTIGLAEIGDNVLLAHNVSILSGRHHHQRGENQNGRMSDGSLTRVCIGRNVWIGAGAVVMADVGDGAIVGAGAVVVKPVPAGATAVGNPARVVEAEKVLLEARNNSFTAD
jgi:virginiamycin A acetyltransferase